MEMFSLQTTRADYNYNKLENKLTVNYKSQYEPPLIGEFKIPEKWAATRVMQFICDLDTVTT